MTLQIEATTLIAIGLTILYYAIAGAITWQQSEHGNRYVGYINLDLWGAFVGVVSFLTATILSLITWMVWL